MGTILKTDKKIEEIRKKKEQKYSDANTFKADTEEGAGDLNRYTSFLEIITRYFWREIF